MLYSAKDLDSTVQAEPDDNSVKKKKKKSVLEFDNNNSNNANKSSSWKFDRQIEPLIGYYLIKKIGSQILYFKFSIIF